MAVEQLKESASEARSAKNYADLMLKKDSKGGDLEIGLFAKAMNVNVALYKKERETLVLQNLIKCDDCTCLSTVHLLSRRGEREGSKPVRYSLFMPKLYSTIVAPISVG